MDTILRRIKKKASKIKTIEWLISRLILKLLVLLNPKIILKLIRNPKKEVKIEPISVSCKDCTF